MSFAQQVADCCGFLADEYGFRFAGEDHRVGEVVEYVKEPLTVYFGWYKGEIDIHVSLSLAHAANHAVFRPYLSRSFALRELALRQNPQAFADWAQRYPKAEYVTTPAQAAQWLGEWAAIMRRYCAPILAGDLALLEQITRERRAAQR